MSLVLYLLGLVSLYFVVVLALRCARGFGQPMADPSPSPEVVGAGPGLVINNDEPQMALESDSRDCVGSNNPSHDRAPTHGPYFLESVIRALLTWRSSTSKLSLPLRVSNKTLATVRIPSSSTQGFLTP